MDVNGSPETGFAQGYSQPQPEPQPVFLKKVWIRGEGQSDGEGDGRHLAGARLLDEIEQVV
jgi:hypothetical protein